MTNHCSTQGCDGGGRLRRGMCQRCYFRWWRANPPPPKTDEERFWEKVAVGSGCWEWTGSRRSSGHGQAYWQGRVRSATHVSLELHGRARIDGTEACHRCDNPPCVNPSHLYWGTRQDNVDDAYARGGRAGGERHSAAQLTEAQVIKLRTDYAAGVPSDELARRYAIKRGSVTDIAAGRKWRTAPGPITTRKAALT